MDRAEQKGSSIMSTPRNPGYEREDKLEQHIVVLEKQLAWTEAQRVALAKALRQIVYEVTAPQWRCHNCLAKAYIDAPPGSHIAQGRALLAQLDKEARK
jgi:hypothetical protein